MIKWLLSLLLLIPNIALAQANIAGLLFASNFANWNVPQGNAGPMSWSSPSFCRVTSGGVTFNAFTTGVPVRLVDTGSPSLSETVTPNFVNISEFGCQISAAAANPHKSFYFATASAGLNEAVSYAGVALNQVIVTPDWSNLGGITSMITSAHGNASVTILDQRSSVIVPYVWSGSAYVAQPFSGSGPPTGAAGGVLSGNYPNPGLADIVQVPVAIYAPIAADGTAFSFTGTATTGSNVITGVSSFTGLVDTQPIYGPGVPIGATITGTNSGASTVTISSSATATTTGTFVIPVAYYGNSNSMYVAGNTLFNQNNEMARINHFDVDVQTEYPFASSPGAGLQGCAADVDNGRWPSGTICDMRGFVTATQPLDLGTAPIEIGRAGITSVLWPNYGIAQLNTAATYLATPATPTLTPTTSTGSLPAGTYYVEINFRTGDGVSASSTETSAIIASPGRITVTGPTCPTYASNYDITASTTSGAELLQGNQACGSNFNLPNTLWLNTAAAPSAATPLPGIILHNNLSAMYADIGDNKEYQIQAASSAVMSNLIATTGNGYSAMKHLFFYNNNGVAMQSVVYDVGNYISSVRDHLQAASSSNGVAYKITGQYNDVSFQDLSLACFSPATSCTLLEILGGYGNSGDTEGIHSINFLHGAFVAPTSNNTAPAIIIQGKSSSGFAAGSGVSGGINLVNFEETSIELGGQSVGVQITDATQVNFNSVNATKATVGGAFLQINATGTVGGGAAIPTTSFIGVRNSPFVQGFTNYAVNNITGVTTPANTTNAGSTDYIYQAGDSAHGGFVNTYQGFPFSYDATSTGTYAALQTFGAGINLSGTTSCLQLLGSCGTANFVMTSQGNSLPPIWQSPTTGNIGYPSPTNNFLPKYSSAGTDLVNSGWSDNGTTITTTEGAQTGASLIATSGASTNLQIVNSNAATSGACTNGAQINQQGKYWTGSASATNTVKLQPVCTPGTNGAITETISSAGSAGPFTLQINGALSVDPSRKGTFTCTAAGTITIANSNEALTSDVIISLNTAGGTITTPPAMKTVTAGTGFMVLCGATDTSIYNYDVIN